MIITVLIEAALVSSLLLAMCANAGSDSGIQFGSYTMYEGRWRRMELPSNNTNDANNTNATNIAVLPLLERTGFMDNRSGVLQGMVFDGKIFLFNIYDRGHLNHLIQLVFLGNEYEKNDTAFSDPDPYAVQNSSESWSGHRTVNIFNYVNTIHKSQIADVCNITYVTVLPSSAQLNISCYYSGLYLEMSMVKAENQEDKAWWLLGLSAAYCFIIIATATSFPTQSRELRDSHYLIKLPYVYAFFAVVAANYFFVSAFTGFKILPPTQYFDSALIIGFGSYLFMWAVVCFTLGNNNFRIFCYTLLLSMILLVNGLYWIDYITQHMNLLTILCSTLWFPFIVAKICVPSTKLLLPYLLFMSTMIVCCLTGTSALLSMHYKYDIDVVWMVMPLATYVEVGFLKLTDTNCWKALRRKLRRFVLPAGYTVFTAQSKEQSPVCENSCPICLNNYDAEQFIRTPCGHVYHYYCLTEWLKQRVVCPICKADLPFIADD